MTPLPQVRPTSAKMAPPTRTSEKGTNPYRTAVPWSRAPATCRTRSAKDSPQAVVAPSSKLHIRIERISDRPENAAYSSQSVRQRQ